MISKTLTSDHRRSQTFGQFVPPCLNSAGQSDPARCTSIPVASFSKMSRTRQSSHIFRRRKASGLLNIQCWPSFESIVSIIRCVANGLWQDHAMKRLLLVQGNHPSRVDVVVQIARLQRDRRFGTGILAQTTLQAIGLDDAQCAGLSWPSSSARPGHRDTQAIHRVQDVSSTFDTPERCTDRQLHDIHRLAVDLPDGLVVGMACTDASRLPMARRNVWRLSSWVAKPEPGTHPGGGSDAAVACPSRSRSNRVRELDDGRCDPGCHREWHAAAGLFIEQSCIVGTQAVIVQDSRIRDTPAADHARPVVDTPGTDLFHQHGQPAFRACAGLSANVVSLSITRHLRARHRWLAAARRYASIRPSCTAVGEQRYAYERRSLSLTGGYA